MDNKKIIEEYIQEVGNEFVGKYSQQLDNHIYDMLNNFGFKGTMNEISDWLEEKNYNILMDENKTDESSTKVIYLLDLKYNIAKALFFITIKTIDENLTYKFSDIIIHE